MPAIMQALGPSPFNSRLESSKEEEEEFSAFLAPPQSY